MLLRPPMRAVLVRAHVVQPHLLFSSTGLGLEEDRFLVVALGTGMVFGTRESGV